MSTQQPRSASGLMGVGVTPVEVELAEQLVDAVPSLEKVLLTAPGAKRPSMRSGWRARSPDIAT